MGCIEPSAFFQENLSQKLIIDWKGTEFYHKKSNGKMVKIDERLSWVASD